MKRNTLLTAMAASMVLVLTGCSKENGTELPSGDPSKLALTGKAIDVSSTGRNTITKADNELLPERTTIGVHIVDLIGGETLSTAKITNVAHTTDAAGTVNIDNPDNPIILTTGYTYDVYAYSPYVAGVNPASLSAIPVNHGVDCLWVKAPGEKPNAATHKVALAFQHATSQITFKVVADAASQPDITGATLEVTGFYGTGTMDLNTGAVTVSAVDPTILFTGIDTHVCFLPAAGQMTMNVKVTIPVGSEDAGDYIGVVKETFTPGKSYTYTITVVNRDSKPEIHGTQVPWVLETGSVDVVN